VSEVVIVDGGSSDNSVAIVREFSQMNPETRVSLLVEPGCNIAEGRNVAIKASVGEVILVSDGGCVLSERWVEEIARPFENAKVDIVGGTYSAISNSYFQRCMAKILIPSCKEFNSDRFIPSSRSIAFRRGCWEAVSGYPEDLKIAEDTKFIHSLLALGYKLVISTKARVFWEQRSSMFGFMKQMFYYAKWDSVARIFTRTQLRCFTNTILLTTSLFFKPFWVLYLISFNYSLLKLRSRFSFRDASLIPGVVLLRIVEDCVRCFGYSVGYTKGLFL